MSKFRKGLRSRKSRSELRRVEHSNNVSNNNIIDPVTGEPENDMPNNIDALKVQSDIEAAVQNSNDDLKDSKEDLDNETSKLDTEEELGLDLKERARFALNQQSPDYSHGAYVGNYNQELDNLFNNELPYDLRRKDNSDDLSYLNKLQDELPKPTIVPHETKAPQMIESTHFDSSESEEIEKRLEDSLPKALRKDNDFSSISSNEDSIDEIIEENEDPNLANDFSAKDSDILDNYLPEEPLNNEFSSINESSEKELKNSDNISDLSESGWEKSKDTEVDDTDINSISQSEVILSAQENKSSSDKFDDEKEIPEQENIVSEPQDPNLIILNEKHIDEIVEPSLNISEKEDLSLSGEQLHVANDVPQDSLEDTFIPQGRVDNCLEDPDRVPVVPTLADDEVPNRPGAILMHARELLGLSVREVANKLQLRVNTVSDIEHDRLNQPTAVPFASVHIGNYARLVNIDARTLVDLYKKNVFEQVNSIRRLNKKEHKKRGPFILFTIGLILVLGAAYATYKFYPSSNESKAGALTLNNDVTSNIDESGVLNLNTQEEPRTEIKDISSQDIVVVSDPNTQKARQQALELEKRNSIFETPKEPEIAQEAPTLVISDNKTSLEQEPKGDVTKTDNAKVSEVDTKTNEEKIKVLSNNSKNETVSNNTLKIVESDSKVKPEVNKSSDESLNKEIELAKEDSKKDEAPKVQVKLGKTRNISQVTIKNREGLASLNDVVVNVKGDVALRITHKNGSVLKEGVFKAGDEIKLKGFPPFRVYVSDSSLVRIKYIGGNVVVPNATQVNFELPTK